MSLPPPLWRRGGEGGAARSDAFGFQPIGWVVSTHHFAKPQGDRRVETRPTIAPIPRPPRVCAGPDTPSALDAAEEAPDPMPLAAIPIADAHALPRWRRPQALLMLMAVASPLAFATWMALLNNFVVERGTVNFDSCVKIIATL